MAWNGYSERGQGSEERGPATFTFTPPGVPQQQGSQPIMAKMGYKTEQSVGRISTYSTGDKTSAALFGFAETLLKPVAKDLAERKFLEGVQRAASGEALTDIVNEQPWYSRIFGPSSAVEGARQYNLDAQAAKFDAAVLQRMPELRNTSPDELPGILQELSKEFRTGDDITDTQLGLRLTKVLPNLVQQHTREFYKAQQEQAVTQRFDAWQQLGTSLQATYAAGSLATEDDRQLRQAGLLQALQLPNGVDPESWKKSLGSFAESLAESGQFHALNTVVDSGVLSALAPDKRLQLERSITAFRKQHAAAAREGFAERLLQVHDRARNDTSYSAAQVFADFDRMNAEYSETSGNSMPVVGTSERVQTGMTAMQAYWARVQQSASLAAKQAEAAAKDADAAQAKIALDTGVRDTIGTNGYAGAVASGVFKKADVDRVFLEDWNKTREDGTLDWDNRLKMLAFHGQFGGDNSPSALPDDVKTELARLVNASGPAMSQNFLNVYQLYKGLMTNPNKGAQAAVTEAFGSKEAAVLVAFDNLVRGSDMDAKGLEIAYQEVRDPLYHPTAKFSAKELPLAQAYIEKEWQGKGFGGRVSETGQRSGAWYSLSSTPDPLTPSSQQLLLSAMSGHYNTLVSRNVPTDEAMKMASRYAKGQVDGVGSFVWSKGGRQDNLLDKVRFADPAAPIDAAELAAGMNYTIKAQAKKLSPKDMTDTRIVRAEDTPDGKQQFIVSFRADDQYFPPVLVTQDDVVANIKALAEGKAENLDKSSLAFGPDITFKPAKGAPSIYASKEEWAAYRAAQRQSKD